MSVKEKDIQNAILAWLSWQPFCIAWPNQSVGIWDEKIKNYRRYNNRFNRKGVSDILGIWKGKFLAIEVKSKTGYPTVEQITFIDDVNKHGGIAFIARSVDEVSRHLTGDRLK